MGKFADRLAWLLGWDVLGVDPHKCHSTQEWEVRLSLPRAAELEVQQIAQAQEQQTRQPQRQLSSDECDRPPQVASESAVAAPSADAASQVQTIAAISPLPLSLVDLLQGMLKQQDGELLLSQVEAIVSKPKFQRVFPQLGQVDRAALIAAFRQLEAQGTGKVDFLRSGQVVLQCRPVSIKATPLEDDQTSLSKPAQLILEKVKNKNVQHQWLDAKWVRNYVFYTKELRQFSPDQIRHFFHELAAAEKGVVEGKGAALRWCFEPDRESSTQN